MKLEFSRQVFENYPNIKFHENPSSVSRIVPCGRTDGHDEANNDFSKFDKAPNQDEYYLENNEINITNCHICNSNQEYSISLTAPIDRFHCLKFGVRILA